jgi:hypothetical protein
MLLPNKDLISPGDENFTYDPPHQAPGAPISNECSATRPQEAVSSEHTLR